MRIFASFTCLFLFLSSIALAQLTLADKEQILGTLSTDPNPASASNMMRTFDGRFKGTKGTPFLLGVWVEGAVVTTKGKKVEGLSLHYDIEEDEIWAIRVGDPIVLNTQEIAQFTLIDLDSTIRTFYKYKIEGKKKSLESHFFEQLVPGEVELLCRREKYFIPANSDPSGYNSHPYSEYKTRDTQFFVLRKGEDKPTKFRKAYSPVLKVLADKKDLVKAYIQKNNLYEIDEGVLMRIFTYYNQL
ncbi:MAG: hypothetical protein AAF694_21350 [Bacteroidota bacterium]